MKGILVSRRVDIEYKGVNLYFDDGKKVIRVSRDVKKGQGLTNYKLVERTFNDKNTKLIYQTTDLEKIASEFSNYVLLVQKRNSIEISPDSLFGLDEIEIPIKWFDIKDRSADKATIKFIANFCDGIDEAYFENLEKTHENFKYDYFYLHAHEAVPYSSKSYHVFKEVSEYIEDYPEYNANILPAIASIKDNKAFVFFTFEDEDAKKDIKRDIIEFYNKNLDIDNVWSVDGLKTALEKQLEHIKDSLENGFADIKQKMQKSLDDKKKRFLETIPPNKIISLDKKDNKEVETHEEFIEYIDNLVAQYGNGVEKFKLKMGEDLKKHYLEGKPKTEKLTITVEDFFDKTNQYYINRSIECIARREERYFNEITQILSHRAKFEKFAEQHFSNFKFRLNANGAIVKYKQHISKSFVVKEFCRILKDDPDFVVTVTGIDEFRLLSDNLHQNALTISHLWDYYHNRHKHTNLEKLSDDWINRTQNWFIEFKKITQVNEIRDITASVIEKYHQELEKVLAGKYYPIWLSDASIKALTQKPATNKWAKHRIEFINSLFQTAAMVNPDNLKLDEILKKLKELTSTMEKN